MLLSKWLLVCNLWTWHSHVHAWCADHWLIYGLKLWLIYLLCLHLDTSSLIHLLWGLHKSRWTKNCCGLWSSHITWMHDLWSRSLDDLLWLCRDYLLWLLHYNLWWLLHYNLLWLLHYNLWLHDLLCEYFWIARNNNGLPSADHYRLGCLNWLFMHVLCLYRLVIRLSGHFFFTNIFHNCLVCNYWNLLHLMFYFIIVSDLGLNWNIFRYNLSLHFDIIASLRNSFWYSLTFHFFSFFYNLGWYQVWLRCCWNLCL